MLTEIKSTPFTLELIMWLTAFLPDPPTPMTLIRANASTSGLICGMCVSGLLVFETFGHLVMMAIYYRNASQKETVDII